MKLTIIKELPSLHAIFRRSLSVFKLTARLSQHRMTGATASIVTSQKSGSTAAYHRFGSFSNLRLHVHRPTREIRAQIYNIIQHKVTLERKGNLPCLTQQLGNNFIEVISHAFGEDDCITPFYGVLASVDHSQNFTFSMNAGMSLLHPC